MPSRFVVLMFGLTLLVQNGAHAFDPFQTSGTKTEVPTRTLSAQSAEKGPSYSLIFIVQAALAHNRDAIPQYGDVNIAAANLGSAKAALFPVITGAVQREFDQTYYSGSFFGASKVASNQLDASMQWTLLDAGGRFRIIRAASELRRAAISDREAAIESVMLNAVQGYLNAASANDVVAWERKLQEFDRAIVNEAQRRQSHGTTSIADVLIAQEQEMRTEIDLNDAVGEEQEAIEIIRSLTGIAGSITFTSALDSRWSPNYADRTVEELVTIAEASNPTVASLQHQLRSSQEKVASAQSALAPSLEVSGNIYVNGRPDQPLQPIPSKEYTLTLGVSVPLFDGLRQAYAVREAKAETEVAKETLRQKEYDLVQNVRTSKVQVDISQNGLRLSSLFVKKSEEALRMEQDEYGRGEGDLLHLIAAEQAAIRAKADWAHAWNKYHNAAWQLSAAIGTVYQDLCVLQGI